MLYNLFTLHWCWGIFLVFRWHVRIISLSNPFLGVLFIHTVTLILVIISWTHHLLTFIIFFSVLIHLGIYFLYIISAQFCLDYYFQFNSFSKKLKIYIWYFESTDILVPMAYLYYYANCLGISALTKQCMYQHATLHCTHGAGWLKKYIFTLGKNNLGFR